MEPTATALMEFITDKLDEDTQDELYGEMQAWYGPATGLDALEEALDWCESDDQLMQADEAPARLGGALAQIRELLQRGGAVKRGHPNGGPRDAGPEGWQP